ncbi:MAG TPA: hypothetical protein VIV57_05725 [Anaeromyxobacter sp.]
MLAEVAEDAEARRERDGRASDERARLEGELTAVAARIEKVADAIARIGYSEPLERKLKTEEQRARELRAELAEAAGAPPRSGRAKLAAARLAERLQELAHVAAKKPREARAALAQVVEAVVLAPQANGRLKATLRLRNETAALASGRPFETSSCGGAIWSKADLLAFAPSLRPARAP